MTLTVRLPHHIEQELAAYCVKRRLTKSDVVKQALEAMLRSPQAAAARVPHPFIGTDKGDGADVSGTIKVALRARLRKRRR